jgi:AraC-like DNA-binding protein
LENFYFFYGTSANKIAFFTNTHAFFYVIGPCAFFYLRSVLSDNSKLGKIDLLHFALFGISFVGYIPYFFSSWDYKLSIANNILSDDWDMAPFHINRILPHQLDQLLNVLQTYFYCIALWALLVHHRKTKNNPIINTQQYQLIRKWLLLFTGIVTVITINFTVAMANMWLYDSKSIFLDRASGALLFAAIVYVGMNMMVMFFPQIMYGLPLTPKDNSIQDPEPISLVVDTFALAENYANGSVQNEIEGNAVASLFSPEYVENIETLLQESIKKQTYLQPDCSLIKISNEIGIPAHHLTYYFNNICDTSFSDWRNKFRIGYVLKILNQGGVNHLTLEAIGLQAGFASNSTFIRSFKKVAGKTPSKYLGSIS